MWRCEGPHCFTQKRARTFASALQGVAAVEASKNPLWRNFVYGSIFDFCNNIGTFRTSRDVRLESECVAKRTSADQSECMGSRLDGGPGCGKITRRAKFRLTRRANQFYRLARLTRQEGRIAIVTNAGWDAVDAAASARKVTAGRILDP
jgi:hypothetical protein